MGAFADAVREHRRRAGLTQEELAHQAGLSVRGLRDLESGRTSAPRPPTVRLLAGAFGLEGRARLAFQEAATGEPAVKGMAVPRPAQLPGAAPDFIGRRAELARLSALTGAVAVISGGAGVGKTALVTHWARTAADRFPDGQLYVDLRGFSPEDAAVAPGTALRVLLVGLGVAPELIPWGTAAQTALYRSTLSEQRLLVVLDNARDVDQVRPLLPGAPECLAVVTSRSTLLGLVAVENAVAVPLAPLVPAEARAMLTSRLSRARVRAEPASVADVVRACAGLPLALAVVSARAATRPDFPLSVVAEELREAATTVEALAGFGSADNPRAAFSWSYDRLAPEPARLFRLLGLHPGSGIGLPAAAGLAARPVGRTRALMHELVAAHLLEEPRPGRFGFHDLLHEYAAELGSADPEAPAATTRMLDHYAGTASAGTALLEPGWSQPFPATGAPFDDADQALAWFTAEHDVLIDLARLAAKEGRDAHTQWLAWSTAAVLERWGEWEVHAGLQRSALTAALRSGDPAGRARAHRALGKVLLWLRETGEAGHHLTEATRLFEAAGDVRDVALTHLVTSVLFERLERWEEALDRAAAAESVFRQLGDRRGRARALNNLGWLTALTGRPAGAEAGLREAIELFQAVGDDIGEASAWDSLGYTLDRLDRAGAAVDCFRRALDIFTRARERHGMAIALGHLGDALAGQGLTADARAAWSGAALAYAELGDPEAEVIRARLSRRT